MQNRWQTSPDFIVNLPPSPSPANREDLINLIRHLDLTTLEGSDTPARVRALCERALAPGPGLPSCAAVCVYPALVSVAAEVLRGTGLGVASVSGGFPAGQTSIAIKAAESAFAVESGATEIDLVINRGAFLAGNFDTVFDEVAATRKAIGKDIALKVILETGELSGPASWKLAAEIVLEAGADVVKTSTGKAAIGATLEAAQVLCQAAAASAAATGITRGFKPAGGVKTPEQAWAYYCLAKGILGGETVANPHYFRIGASSLLDAIILAVE